MTTEKKNRWLINIILGIALLAFLGISVMPMIGGFSGENQATPTVTPSQAANADAKKKELQDRAKGYELVLQREPENQTALKGFLEARLELLSLGEGSVKDVIPSLEKLVKLNPNVSNYGVLLAQAKEQDNDPEAAVQVYRDILQKKPGDSVALNGLVVLLMKQKKPEMAIGLLQDTLKTAPQVNQVQPGQVDVTSVQVMLGGVYAEQKRYDEAIAIYDEAAKDNKQDFRPIFAKAMILKEQGKTEESKALFEQASDLAPPQYKDKIKQLATTAPAPATLPNPVPMPSIPTPDGTSPTPSPSASP